ILSFLAVLAESFEQSSKTDIDIAYPALGVVLNDDSYGMPEESAGGSSFQITVVDRAAVFSRTYHRYLMRPLPQLIALKAPKKEAAEDDARLEDCLASLTKEVHILGNSHLKSHENVVSLLGVCWRTWEIEDRTDVISPALVLEMADEGDLDFFMSRNTTVHPLQRLAIALDLCFGVRALHGVGLAHCDVKPTNFLVFLDGDSYIAKIADFGSSVSEDSSNRGQTDALGGTPVWQPPERQGCQTFKELIAGDVYSLTLVLWSLITQGEGGRRLVNADEEDQLEGMKLNGTLVTEVDESFANWLRALGVNENALSFAAGSRLSSGLQTEPDQGAVSVDDTIKVLRRIAENLPVTTASTSDCESASNYLIKKTDRKLETKPLPGGNIILPRRKKVFWPVAYPVCTAMLADSIRDKVLADLKRTAKSSSSDPTEANAAGLQYLIMLITFRRLDDDMRQDINDGLELVGESAARGNTLARQRLGPIFEAFNRPIPPLKDQTIDDILLQETLNGSLIAQRQLQRKSQSLFEDARKFYRSHLTGTGECNYVGDAQPVTVSCGTLGEAANAGRVESLDQMLSGGCNVNQTFEKNETSLLRACRHGHKEMVERLLDAGADPRIATTANKTPLHFLPSFDDVDIPHIAQLLLSHGADIEALSSGEAGESFDLFSDIETYGTPLSWAVDADSRIACKELVARGADPWRPSQYASPIERAAENHQYYLLGVLYSGQHALPRRMLPTSADLLRIERCPIQGNSHNEIETGPVYRALLNSWQYFGGPFRRLSLHAADFKNAFASTLEILLTHGQELPIGSDDTNAVLEIALHYPHPLRIIEWILNWYKANKEPFPLDITESVAILVDRDDHVLFDKLLMEGVIPPSSSAIRQKAIIRIAGLSDDIYYIKHYVDVEAEYSNNEQKPDLTCAFENAVVNGRYSVAGYLFDEGYVDLFPFKEQGSGYHEAANVLGRLLLSSKRFKNLEGRVRWVGHLMEKDYCKSRQHSTKAQLLVLGNQLGVSPLHAAVVHSEFREHLKPDGKIVNAILESMPSFNPDMSVLSFSWHGWTPFHVAADVGNLPALNEFLGREDINFNRLTADGENAYDIAVSRFGSPTKSMEYWEIPEKLREAFIRERDNTTIKVINMLHNDFGLQPHKKILTIYRPNEDHILIIPPSVGRVIGIIVNVED
ncbi:ankyrin repeat domain-containing protein 17, partial [Aspergillus brasiliensis]